MKKWYAIETHPSSSELQLYCYEEREPGIIAGREVPLIVPGEHLANVQVWGTSVLADLLGMLPEAEVNTKFAASLLGVQLLGWRMEVHEIYDWLRTNTTLATSVPHRIGDGESPPRAIVRISKGRA